MQRGPSHHRAQARVIGACGVALVIGLVGWLAVARPAPVAAQASPLAWAWSGGVTSEAATVVARVRQGAPVRLVVTPDREGADSLTFPSRGFVAPDATGVARFHADGLAQATRYRYRVETEAGSGLDGRFRTFARGPFSFRFAFASCASTGSNHRVFDAIRELTPDLFIHMGDFHYMNISRNDVAAYRGAYDRVLASARQGLLYRSTPIVYIFDDHDFGANDADGTSASRPAAMRAYRERVPSYPLQDGDESTLQQAFDIGRVRVIVTDTRTARASLRSRRPRTMLGAQQLEWLEQQLTDAKDAPLVVWVNTVPWITKSRESTVNGWAQFSEERQRLADHVESLGLTSRVVMLSGDGHMAAIDDGTNSSYASSRTKDTRGFVVAHAAPLDRWTRIKGGPYSHGVSRHNHQFGVLDVADSGTALDVTVSARNAAGAVIPGLLLRLRCEKDACRPVPAR